MGNISKERILKFKSIASKKWYIQGFNCCFNYICHGPESGITGLHKELGYGYTKMLFTFKKDYMEYGYLEQDFADCGKKFMELLAKDPDYFKKIKSRDEILASEAFRIHKEIEDTGLEKLDKEKTFELYRKAWKAYPLVVDVSHLIESISYVVEPMMKKRLEKALKMDRHDKEFRSIFSDLMQPAKPSFANDEHTDILKITQEIMKDAEKTRLFADNSCTPEETWKKLDKKTKDRITQHKKMFFFNQLNYYYAEPLTEINYTDEIKKLIEQKVDVESKIEDEKKAYERNVKKRNDIIAKYRLNEEAVKLITLTVDTLHWQDERKKNILSGVYYMGLMLRQLSKKWSIDIELLKRYGPHEITLERLKNFDYEDAKRRVEHFAVYMEIARNERKGIGIDYDVIVEKEYDEFMKAYNEEIMEHKDLHGTSASPGKATGPVRICRTKEDIEKFKKGEILVAAMTRPEYVPAMRLAAAIVTDEGGITCHAAIVSRELGIPCVIGTKVATKVLKDGEFVDVNANHAIVRKVE